MGAGTFQEVVRLGLKNERRRHENRGVEGAELRAPKARGLLLWGRGVPSPAGYGSGSLGGRRHREFAL